MDFYNKVSAECYKKGISMSYMCDSIGISCSSPRGWKAGAKPQASTVKKIADFFGVPLSYFTGGAEEERPQGVQIPVLGHVAAGIPIDAIEDVIDVEEITPEMARTGKYMALRISGHSMEPKISDGDVVIVRRQETVENDEIAIVMINGDNATCKKVKQTPDGLFLYSTNPAFKPMFYTNEQVKSLPITILGKVVELRAKF